MYKFVNAKYGTVIGYSDFLYYIYKSESGCYVHCDKQIAQGVVVLGKPYNISDLNELDDVIITETDSGSVLSGAYDSISETQLALCEVYELTLVTASSISGETSELSEIPSAIDFVYASLIKNGVRTIDSVPERNRSKVEEIVSAELKPNPN